jgi:predicted small secreted protein
MFKIVSLTFLLLISTTFISGCSTMSGIGQDVESVGDAIEDSAEENKSY